MFDFETIKLHCGAWQAEIAPQMGMNTVRLTCDGRAVLRSPVSWEALKEGSCVYGTPILLPPNRTEEGRFTFDGKTWQLDINEPAFRNHLHGYVHCQSFAVKSASDTHVSAVYENKGETFPYPYRMEVNFSITQEGYLQEFLITNTGDSDMPVAFGLHTVFAAPQSIAVPIHKRWKVNSCHIPTGELEELSDEAQTYRDGVNPNGREVRGFYTSCGYEARLGEFCYRVSDNFNQWVLWNAEPDSGFCAVEPMCGAVNALNSGEGLLRLTAGDTVRFATAIYKKAE